MIATCLDCGRAIPVSAPDSFCPVCLLSPAFEFVSPEESVVQPTPHTNGRYQELAEHARGGMGRVILARDTQFNRRVALKEQLPFPGSAHDSNPTLPMNGGSHRFLREAQVMARLEHPGIVPVYEMGRRADGSHYYVMRFIEGRTLGDALHKAISLQERIELLPAFVAVCQAVAFAHSRGVIHRDIKPMNILLGNYGETVVADWGIAKVLDTAEYPGEEHPGEFHTDALAGHVATQHGETLGTPATSISMGR